MPNNRKHKRPNNIISTQLTKKNNNNGSLSDSMIHKFDPAFQPPCYATIKKDIGFGYQTAFQAIKEIIIQNCEIAAITTDLWTSRAKTGYIGITCHWLTEKM